MCASVCASQIAGIQAAGKSGWIPERLAQHTADPRFKNQFRADTIPVSAGKTAREIQEQLTLDYGGRDDPTR